MLRLLAAVLLVALSSPASADWTQAQRAEFLGQCVESCQSTLKLPASKLGKCQATCGCVADQTETTVTPAEMDAVEEASAAGGTTETMLRIRGYFPACARKAVRMP